MLKHRLLAMSFMVAVMFTSTAFAETATTTAKTEPATTGQTTAAATPTPSPTPTPAPNETFDQDNAIVLKNGSSCDEVIMLQSRLRDLGYFNYKITNYYGTKTEEAVAAFQKNNGLTADGVAGPDTYNVLFNNNAKRAPIVEVVKPTPKPTPTPKPATTKKASSNKTDNSSNTNSKGVPIGEMKDWFKWVRSRFTRGDKVQVIDVATGIKLNMIMVGGHNHADVEPATKDDTAKLKKAYGGSWSWERRAVVVKINGIWVAGSINGMPHGYETVSGNNMDGQVCIHFLNSKTHVRDLPDSDHQRMVRKAAGK